MNYWKKTSTSLNIPNAAPWVFHIHSNE